MGASIRVIETTAIITGVDQLVGARVNATDLRAGAAMVVAGAYGRAASPTSAAWITSSGVMRKLIRNSIPWARKSNS